MFSAWVKRAGQRCAIQRTAMATRHASTATTSSSTTTAAYAEALKLIDADKQERLRMLARVEKEIARVAKDNKSSTQAAQLAALNSLKYDLQVKSELNNPDVQRNFKNGQVDMSQPVYRYMRQKQFEKQPRARLLERITQMNVIPDLLPLGLVPTVEVNIQAQGADSVVEPGTFTKPAETIQAPQVEVVNFHTEPRLYTLMLVDPDSPDVVNKTYQQRCHWLLANVPLSTTESIVKGGDVVLDYCPPHPEKGTKYHRYTLIAYEQPENGQAKVDIKVEGRDAFDVKALAEQHGLKVTGASFFRQVWDETVSSIYEDILKTQEPFYGKPRKPERYIQRAVYF